MIASWREVATVGLVNLAALVGLYAAWWLDPGVTSENRLIENIQAVALAAGFLLLAAAYAARRTVASPWLGWWLMLLLLGMFLREVDVEHLDVPQILITLGSGKGRNLMLVLLVVGSGVATWRRRAALVAELRAVRGDALLAVPAVGALCYAASWPFDKGLSGLAPAHSLLAEELFETVAALCLGATALLLLRTRRGKK